MHCTEGCTIVKVLVACEFSGAVRSAFAARGHMVVSVDYLPAEDGAQPNVHGAIGFHVRDDILHYLTVAPHKFDLMVAHPPCTYLSLSGNRWRASRPRKALEALEFALRLWEAPIPKIAIEQPRSILGTIIGKRTQEIHPYEFGVPEFKTTWLWLKGLPPLRPTIILDPPKLGTKTHDVWSVVHRAAPGPDRWKERSRTFPEIAAAMAEQWDPVTRPQPGAIQAEPGYDLAGAAA